jgi:hypothetical protein
MRGLILISIVAFSSAALASDDKNCALHEHDPHEHSAAPITHAKPTPESPKEGSKLPLLKQEVYTLGPSKSIAPMFP